MKQKLIYILIICFICTYTAACQPTPGNTAVVNKNEGVLESRINEAASGVPSFDITGNINEEVYTKEGKYSVVINAGVEKMTLDAYPVYLIVPDDFAQDEVDSAIAYFFKGSPLYAQDYTRSKSMIEDEIVQLRAELQKMDGSNPDDIEGAEYAIKKLEEEYESAPETITRTQITSKLTVPSGVDYETLDAVADLGYPDLSSISVANKPIFQSLRIIFDKSRGYGFTSLKLGEKAEGQRMTIEEAKQKAIDVINDLGINFMIPERAEIGLTEGGINQGYVVSFRRNVNGVPVADNKILNYAEKKVDLAAKWPGDQITMGIDDKGISYFNWNHKGKVQEELTPNVEMLTFDQIMDIARQQLKNKFAWIDTRNPSYYQTIHIDNIILEYACAQKKDNPGQYLLVPAWNFYGGITNNYGSGEPEEQFGRDKCILSLNAVDGSVIGSSD